MKKIYYLMVLLASILVGCETTGGEGGDVIDKPVITIPSGSLSIVMDYDEVSKNISFSSVADWYISVSEVSKTLPNWMRVNPTSGPAGNATISIELDENDTTEERSAVITIIADNSEKSITVTQKAFEPTLTIDKTNETLEWTEGSFKINLESNGSWKVQNIPNWMTLSHTIGSSNKTITLSYRENDTADSRHATLLFSCGNIERKLIITQKAYESILTLDITNETVPCNAGSMDINLEADIDWSTSDIPSWVTLNPTSGSSSQLLTLTYEENETTDPRVAVIKFNNRYIERKLTITQEAFEPILSLDITNETVSSIASSLRVNLESNLDWSASQIPFWITLNSTSGSGDQEIELTIDENEYTTSRTAVIQFRNEYKIRTLTIKQEGFEPILTLDVTSETVSPNSGVLGVYLESNLDWSASNIPSWITLDPSSGNGSETITLSYDQNSDNRLRTATIIFYNSEYNISKTVEITQRFVQLEDMEQEEL